MVILSATYSRVREDSMRISSRWGRRSIAVGLVMFLASPLAEAAAELPQQAPSSQQQSVPPTENQPQGSSNAVHPNSPDQSGQPSNSQATPDQPQSGTTKPVGTAAAPLDRGTGVAATRPAGAVIAPAKQRRARTILIRVGVIVGAAVAVGVVVGLSKSSSGRPPS
jgi:hypothetical protein